MQKDQGGVALSATLPQHKPDHYNLDTVGHTATGK